MSSKNDSLAKKAVKAALRDHSWAAEQKRRDKANGKKGWLDSHRCNH